MMSSNFFSFNLNNMNLSYIKESYLNLKEDEAKSIELKDYPFSTEETRKNMINWLIFLCNTLNFTNQTLFRSVNIFDQYICTINKKEIDEMTQEKLNLITIACLSLSTKLEEINCNYINFFNEKVLNTPNEKKFTNKDLTKMELIILKALKFKTLYSTSIDFIEIYLEIFKNFLGPNNSFLTEQIILSIKNISIDYMKNNINNDSYLINNASEFAYLCFLQSLIQLNMINSFNMKQFEKAIITFGCQFSSVF